MALLTTAPLTMDDGSIGSAMITRPGHQRNSASLYSLLWHYLLRGTTYYGTTYFGRYGDRLGHQDRQGGRPYSRAEDDYHGYTRLPCTRGVRAGLRQGGRLVERAPPVPPRPCCALATPCCALAAPRSPLANPHPLLILLPPTVPYCPLLPLATALLPP